MKTFEALLCNVLRKDWSSLVPSPRTSPGEKRSGEQSQTSWAYSPKVVRTNEIARTVITT